MVGDIKTLVIIEMCRIIFIVVSSQYAKRNTIFFPCFIISDERIKCSVTAGKYSKKSTYKCVQVWVRVWNRGNTTLLSESSFLQWNEYELYTDSDVRNILATAFYVLLYSFQTIFIHNS